jgi:hypothetical protein
MASTTCSIGCRPLSSGIYLAKRSQETRSSTPHCRPRICTPSTPRANCIARKGSHSKQAWLGLCKFSNAARQLTTALKCKTGREQVAKGTTCAAAAQGEGGTSDSLPAALLFDCDGESVESSWLFCLKIERRMLQYILGSLRLTTNASRIIVCSLPYGSSCVVNFYLSFYTFGQVC